MAETRLIVGIVRLPGVAAVSGSRCGIYSADPVLIAFREHRTVENAAEVGQFKMDVIKRFDRRAVLVGDQRRMIQIPCIHGLHGG